jgi:hypothetical protein
MSTYEIIWKAGTARRAVEAKGRPLGVRGGEEIGSPERDEITPLSGTAEGDGCIPDQMCSKACCSERRRRGASFNWPGFRRHSFTLSMVMATFCSLLSAIPAPTWDGMSCFSKAAVCNTHVLHNLMCCGGPTCLSTCCLLQMP